MQTPTAEDVRAALPKVDWAGRGYPVDNPDPLETLVALAVGYVKSITWRDLATLPTDLEPVMLRAVALATAQEVVQSDDDYVGTVNDDAIQSFSVGPYSETRRDPQRRGEQQALNSWPALDRVLWLLLSLAPGEINPQVEERYEWWVSRLTGVNAPYGRMLEVDWTSGITGRAYDAYLGPTTPGVIDMHDVP